MAVKLVDAFLRVCEEAFRGWETDAFFEPRTQAVCVRLLLSRKAIEAHAYKRFDELFQRHDPEVFAHEALRKLLVSPPPRRGATGFPWRKR